MEDDGTTEALAKGGVTDLARTTGRTSLARGLGGISLVRIAHIRTRGLGAFRSRVLSLASWAVPRPRPLSASSSSLLAR